MDGVAVDTTQLHEWSVVLGHAARDCPEEVKKVTGRGCNNIKQEWKRRWSGHAHLPHLPHTINYDVTRKGDIITGEVGPDRLKGGQAPLAAIIEYGQGANAPIPGGAPALEMEAPRYERALANLGVELLDET